MFEQSFPPFWVQSGVLEVKDASVICVYFKRFSNHCLPLLLLQDSSAPPEPQKEHLPTSLKSKQELSCALNFDLFSSFQHSEWQGKG